MLTEWWLLKMSVIRCGLIPSNLPRTKNTHCQNDEIHLNHFDRLVYKTEASFGEIVEQAAGTLER